MYTMSFIETFIEVYNACSAFVIIFLIGHILSMMHRVDKDLLKAKLFLNDAVLQLTWMYISISGAAFALNAVIKLVVRFTTRGEVLNTYYMIELTQLIFLIAFIGAAYNWYVFIGSFAGKK